MANALFDPGREGFLDGSYNWSSSDVRAMLVKSTYTFSAAHKFITDLGANDNGRTAALGSKTVTNGVADAADTSLTATSAVACNALVIFYHTGSDATARLIAYIDTPTSGLPFTPSASQTVNRRWTVSRDGNPAGSSFRGTPTSGNMEQRVATVPIAFERVTVAASGPGGKIGSNNPLAPF